MPHHKSALKRTRQNENKRMRNRMQRSYYRKTVKAFEALGSPEEMKERFPETVSIIDKTAKKGLIHHKKADRLKSSLSRKINQS